MITEVGANGRWLSKPEVVTEAMEIAVRSPLEVMSN
jgi:hypothetical protein